MEQNSIQTDRASEIKNSVKAVMSRYIRSCLFGYSNREKQGIEIITKNILDNVL
jgi:hypothetical protein